MTDASDDLFIKDLEREFGDSGYAFWFKTMELIGAHGEGGKLYISWANYLEKLHKSRARVEQLLNYCSTNGKVSFTSSELGVELDCPKFAEFADNYTKYDGVSSKRLQRHFKVSSKQEEEVEEEVEVHKKKIKDSVHPKSLDEVVGLFQERNYIDPQTEAEKFWNYYESNGWRVGRNPMKNWKAAAANWNKNAKQYRGQNAANRQGNRQTGAGGTTTADDLRRSLDMARKLADDRKARGE